MPQAGQSLSDAGHGRFQPPIAPVDTALEQARRDYILLDKEKRKGVDAFCSKYSEDRWRDCFISRVKDTKALQERQEQARRQLLDAQKAKEDAMRNAREQNLVKDLERQTKRKAAQAAPPAMSSSSEKTPYERYLSLQKRRQDIIKADLPDPCAKTPSMWYCTGDPKEAISRLNAKEQQHERAVAERRPPPMRAPIDRFEHDRTYHFGVPSTRRA